MTETRSVIPEVDLLKRARKGDQAAFGELVKRYQDMVFTLVCRTLGRSERAADVSQEVFIRAWRGLSNFQEKSKFSSWLYRITVNCCISEIRKSGKMVDDLGSEELETLRIPTAENDHFEKQVEKKDLIERLLSQLPPLYRTMVVLHYLQDLDLQEIAIILDRPLGTVKAYLHRARKHLRQHAEMLLINE
ncbi:MAG: sigma-70 family RNA polymerase sigma factor [bacterium]